MSTPVENSILDSFLRSLVGDIVSDALLKSKSRSTVSSFLSLYIPARKSSVNFGSAV